ncbi:MAG TPA: hypothetical protein VNO30_41360 [Kofleriaceae bacterium]|nr:hypothetical protein [Kofleriaceae bacterium]
MRRAILAAGVVMAGLVTASVGNAEPAAAAQDLDTVGEGIMIGDHARLETRRGPVHVWTPRGYDPRTAITVVYVHGYSIDVDEAWWGHGLPEQFGHASINALFIACEAPQNKWQAVQWKSLSALLETVEASGQPLPQGRVTAIGHSGAYRTLQEWTRDPRLDTLVMLDAGYGHLGWVRSWVLGKPHRRLIDIGDDALLFTDRLHYFLPKTVRLQGFGAFSDPAQLARLSGERIVYVRTRIGHYNIASGALALPSVLRILGAPSIDAAADPAATVTASRDAATGSAAAARSRP